jgi:hypothetical protein
MASCGVSAVRCGSRAMHSLERRLAGSMIDDVFIKVYLLNFYSQSCLQNVACGGCQCGITCRSHIPCHGRKKKINKMVQYRYGTGYRGPSLNAGLGDAVVARS